MRMTFTKLTTQTAWFSETKGECFLQIIFPPVSGRNLLGMERFNNMYVQQKIIIRKV